MLRRLNLIFLIILLLFKTVPVFGLESEEIIIKMPHGTVNWSKGTIQATGIGVFPPKGADEHQAQQTAESTAKIAARKNLLQIIGEINIDSETTVKDIFTVNPTIKIQILQMVSALDPIDTVKELPGGTFRVTLQLGLRGKISRLVLPAEIKQIKPIKPIAPANKAGSIKVGNTKQSIQNSQSKPILHTGMIVNAKGLRDARPAMVPTIVDESGQEIYGPAFVSREFAVLAGITGYSRNLVSAQNDPRVRYNPLIVKGLKTKTIDGSVIVVSNSDASKLRAASEHLSFLRKCRVIIVLD